MRLPLKSEEVKSRDRQAYALNYGPLGHFLSGMDFNFSLPWTI